MKILWAVNIHEGHPRAINGCNTFLHALSKKIKIQVDAISIVFPVEYALPKNKVLELENECLKLLNKTLKKVKKNDWFGRSIILLEAQIPQRVAVLDLTDFAKTNGYDALLLVKHSGDKSRSRYLGSFAEMTSFLSSIPIFLVNPDGVIPKDIGRVIIALDESEKKEQYFKSIIRFLPIEGLIIKLFHRIKIPFYFLSKDSIKKHTATERKNLLEAFESIRKIGINTGRSVELDIKNTKKNISDSILQEAKKGAFDLIITIHKGVEAPGYLLGRVTRNILQNADRPVLLLRP